MIDSHKYWLIILRVGDVLRTSAVSIPCISTHLSQQMPVGLLLTLHEAIAALFSLHLYVFWTLDGCHKS